LLETRWSKVPPRPSPLCGGQVLFPPLIVSMIGPRTAPGVCAKTHRGGFFLVLEIRIQEFVSASGKQPFRFFIPPRPFLSSTFSTAPPACRIPSNSYHPNGPFPFFCFCTSSTFFTFQFKAARKGQRPIPLSPVVFRSLCRISMHRQFDVVEDAWRLPRFPPPSCSLHALFSPSPFVGCLRTPGFYRNAHPGAFFSSAEFPEGHG